MDAVSQTELLQCSTTDASARSNSAGGGEPSLRDHVGVWSGQSPNPNPGGGVRRATAAARLGQDTTAAPARADVVCHTMGRQRGGPFFPPSELLHNSCYS